MEKFKRSGTYDYDRLRVLTIIPPFIPSDGLKSILEQAIPGSEVYQGEEAPDSDAEALVVTAFTRVDASLLEHMKNLKFVQVTGAGYDNVDMDEVRKRGIAVSNVPSANVESVAEHVIMVALVQLRDLFRLHDEVASGKWPLLERTHDLMGRKFGIIGMGSIGKSVARRLVPFGTETIYFSRNRLGPDLEKELSIAYVDMETLLAESDIISIHVPLNRYTSGMIGGNEFSTMKNGTILINTSRGEVVQEDALLEAVRGKGIRPCLDVFRNEPPLPGSEVLAMKNSILSPHNSGVTAESQQRVISQSIGNVSRFIHGEEPLNRVA